MAAGNFPPGVHPLIKPGEGTLLFDHEYPQLGHDDGNPHLICRTMFLLLRSMLFRYKDSSEHMALAPVTCLSDRALVPEILSPEMMAEYLQAYIHAGGVPAPGSTPASVWRRKIDRHDLRVLFGTAEIRTYEPTGMPHLIGALQAALRPTLIRPVALPEYADRIGRTPCVWARQNNRTYVLTGMDGHARVFEAKSYDGEIILEDMQIPADTWMQAHSPRWVTTTPHAWRIYLRDVLAEVAGRAVTAMYGPGMAVDEQRSVVGECLALLGRHLPSGPGAEFWLPGA